MNLAIRPSAIRLFKVYLVVCLLPSLLVADDWRAFRGTAGVGASEDANIAVRWTDTENMLWTQKLPGRGFSSPIVVGDSILVTCFKGDGGNLDRMLICYGLGDGSIKWSKTVGSKAEESTRRFFATDHGFASQTPVSDGERIFAFFGNAGIFAFDMQGKKLWEKNLGTENNSMFGSATSPMLYKDMVIVSAGAESGAIYALNAATGKQVWKTDAEPLSRSYASPIIATNPKGDDVLLVSVPNELWGLNPMNGKLRWYAETQIDTNACPGLLVEGHVVFAIGGRSGGRIAVRLGGKDDVTESHVLWSERGGSYVPSPVLYKGHLYWIKDDGVAICVDAKTGKEVERKRIGGRFYASLVRIRDKFYAVSRFDGTHVLKADKTFEQIAINKLQDESDFSASPAVSNGYLILRSDSNLYCIKQK